MSKKFLKFGDIEIVKHEFHYSKSPISIRNIGVDKLTISDKFVSRQKIFSVFHCLQNEVVTLLYIMLTKITGYVKRFDKMHVFCNEG